MNLPKEKQTDVDRRLKRIEGQVRGLSRMVSQGRYCGDVLDQISAVQVALRGVAKIVARNHLETCVTDALRSGKRTRAEKTYEEIMHLLYDQLK